MNFMSGVLASLAAMVSAAILVGAWKHVRSRTVRRILSISEGKAAIVVGGHAGFKPHWSMDLFVHAESVFSVGVLAPMFSNLGIPLDYLIDKQMGEHDLLDLEICIGGNNSNARTASYQKRYMQQFFDSQGNTVSEKQAVIAKLNIPLGREGGNRTVLLLYGQHTTDTYAAVSFFRHNFRQLVAGALQSPNVLIRLKTNPDLGHNSAEVMEKTLF